MAEPLCVCGHMIWCTHWYGRRPWNNIPSLGESVPRLTQPDPPSRIQTLLRRGSKFRYSGRTLRQTQKAKLDRPDHNFTRYVCLSACPSLEHCATLDGLLDLNCSYTIQKLLPSESQPCSTRQQSLLIFSMDYFSLSQQNIIIHECLLLLLVNHSMTQDSLVPRFFSLQESTHE